MKALFITVIFSTSITFSAENKKADTHPLLKKVEGVYSKAKTLTVDFDQTTRVNLTQTTKKDSGQISFKRPDKIHWQTMEPNPNLLVSDGKSYWIYNPPFDSSERGQVIIRKASQVRSKLATALLSGQFSTQKDVTIKTLSAQRFEIVPKKGSAGDIIRAVIEIDSKTDLIKQVDLIHENKNEVKLELKNIRLGSNLPDKMFVFKTPEGTDVFRE